jgi:hypothetical protein
MLLHKEKSYESLKESKKKVKESRNATTQYQVVLIGIGIDSGTKKTKSKISKNN